MSAGSAIEWTDATWNPVVGCTRASAGCDHCYAVTMTRRLAAMGQEKYQGLVNEGKGHFNGTVRLAREALELPLRWRNPRLVFVNSMSDLFHEGVPDEYIAAVFGVMAACPDHTFQVLTKRPERAVEWFRWVASEADSPHFVLRPAAAYELGDGSDADYSAWGNRLWNLASERYGDGAEPASPWPLPNVWLGTSCEDQETADERIPHLLNCPAAVRWVSAEPLLGPIDFGGYVGPRFRASYRPSDLHPSTHTAPDDDTARAVAAIARVAAEDRGSMFLDWIVAGGESGAQARPCDVAWMRSIRYQCREAGVPLFVKQLGTRPFEHHDRECTGRFGDWPLRLRDRKGGDWSEWPEDLRVRGWPTARGEAR